MENVFNVKYNAKLDRLEIPKKRKQSGMARFIHRHKFIFVVSVLFCMLSIFNFYLIFSFMSILSNSMITLY